MPDVEKPQNALLRKMMETLGGSLKHAKRNEPRGGTWVLALGEREVRIRPEGRSYPLLDACYRVKEGVLVAQTWDDHQREIDAAGLAQLFSALASAPPKPEPEVKLDFAAHDNPDNAPS